MNKKSIVVFILLLAATLAFSLEFKLEYHKFLPNLYYPENIYFFSDSEVIYCDFDGKGKQKLFTLNIGTEETQTKLLNFIDDLCSLTAFFKIINSEYVIYYTDSSSTSSLDWRYAIVNFDTETYKSISHEELTEILNVIHHFNYDKSNIIIDDYRLFCYVDSETDDVNEKTAWWADDGFLKIAFIVSDSDLSEYYASITDTRIVKVIQTLKNEDGEDLIIGFHESSVYYDSEREKLIILSDFGYDKNGEPDLDFKYDLYIYKLIYDATCNDTHVRIREEPNLSCSTLGYLNTGDDVKVTDKSDEPFEIDGESWYWYKVESATLPDGWVYGKYLDIEE